MAFEHPKVEGRVLKDISIDFLTRMQLRDEQDDRWTMTVILDERPQLVELILQAADMTAREFGLKGSWKVPIRPDPRGRWQSGLLVNFDPDFTPLWDATSRHMTSVRGRLFPRMRVDAYIGLHAFSVKPPGRNQITGVAASLKAVTVPYEQFTTEVMKLIQCRVS